MAFTLIELLAVVTILALAAAALAVSVKPSIAAARLESAGARVESLDHLFREGAVRQQQVRYLVLDPSRGKIFRSDGGKQAILDQGLPVARVLTSEGEHVLQPIQIPYRSDGSSPTFCIEFEANGLKRWTFISGGSGQITHLENESDARRILERLRSL